jgi:hypothetical protein
MSSAQTDPSSIARPTVSALPPPALDGPPAEEPAGNRRSRRRVIIVSSAAAAVLGLAAGAFLVGRTTRQSTIDDLVASRDALYVERDELATERDGLVAERDGLRAERDDVVGERDDLRTEVGALGDEVRALEASVASRDDELAGVREDYQATGVCAIASEQAVSLADQWEDFLVKLDAWMQTEIGSAEEASIGRDLDAQSVKIADLRIELEGLVTACRMAVPATGE